MEVEAKSNVHVLLGGRKDHHIELLRKAARAGTAEDWTALSAIKAGDSVLFYFVAPYRAVVGVGKALEDARPTRTGYRVKCSNVRLLKDPLKREDLLRVLPEWTWLKQTRSDTTPVKSIATKLHRICGEGEETQGTTLSGEELERELSRGAGFGSSENNRKIEQAAIHAAKKLFEDRGFQVRSCKSDYCGYDLEARKGGNTLCIEVKGVQGAKREFTVTSNELRFAQKDSRFRLCVVTNALSSKPCIEIVNQKAFLSQFAFAPLAYRAKLKPGYKVS